MRWLAAVMFVGPAAAIAPAADTDEERAKEVAVAFLKAVKAKDLDAVMKTVDVPFLFQEFLFQDRKEPLTKTDELKGAFKKFLENVSPAKVPTEVGTAFDLPAIRKKAEAVRDTKFAETAEKLIGKTGYLVVFVQDGKECGMVLVRIKDGQAKVVWIPN